MITADKIASLMIGAPVVTFDQLAASAIAELGNMITRESAALLSTQGYQCEISTPTILRGTNVNVSPLEIPALVIPLDLAEIGRFEIAVGLEERDSVKAA